LTTNASKFGALATPKGRIEVKWSVELKGEERWLHLEWLEKGVAIAVAGPRRDGFGVQLITRRIAYDLRGRGAVTFRPGGIQCTIEFPLHYEGSILQTNWD
jgi:two-component sensor histidine kinase